MITINDKEILTVQDGMTFGGAKDQVARSLSFSFIYAPNDDKYPSYNAKVGDKIKWIEDDKTRFYGYIQSINYTTDDNLINVDCIDLSIRMLNSKAVGRFKGTLKQLADQICGIFHLTNGITDTNSTIHNIVTDGDLSYFDIINQACKVLYKRYCIYLDGLTLKIVSHDVVDTFEIGKTIRTSTFNSDMSELCNQVVIIDDKGKVLKTIQDTNSINKFGIFQQTYSYNKDCKNNVLEAQKLIKDVTNKASLVVDNNNNNNIISGCYIKIIEPINNYNGIFEVITDNHTINTYGSYMELEVEYVG